MGARSAENAFYCSKTAIFINIAPHLKLSYLTKKFFKNGRAQRGKFFNKPLLFHDFPYQILCVDRIQSPPHSILCVDKIQSPPNHILCVPKTQSPPTGILCVDKIQSPPPAPYLYILNLPDPMQRPFISVNRRNASIY